MTALRASSMPSNRILGSLTRDDREMLEPHLEPVTLKFRQRLELADHKIASIYFIDAGLASVVTVAASGRRRAEVAVLGREGMTGVAILLGVDRSPHETVVQIEGHGRCIGASALRDLMGKNPALAAVLLRYAHVFAVQ